MKPVPRQSCLESGLHTESSTALAHKGRKEKDIMTNYERAQAELIKALKALDRAATLIGDTPEYNDRNGIFHAQTVSQYNRIVTASQIINEAQI